MLRKYKGLILYAVFGVLTTAVNMGSYYICFNVAGIPNVPATVIAWLLAVLFAFITNKIWVFDSKSFDKKTLFHELWTFFACRIATGVLDVGIMYFAVDLLNMNSTLWKLISNILVIIINYVFSKLVIFKKAKDDKNGGERNG